MPRKNLEQPFLPIGDLLKNWRRQDYRSALALYQARPPFSFSYSAYGDYERGVILPSAKAILEIATYLKKDPVPALYLWLAVQLPDSLIKEQFLSAFETAKMLEPTERLCVDAAPRSMENTWVFGPKEIDKFKRYPWLWEICTAICLVFPKSMPLDLLKLPKGVSLSQLLRKHLNSWIKDRRVIISGDEIQLASPYIYLPDTIECHDIRMENLRRAVEFVSRSIGFQVIEKGEAYRKVIHKALTKKQAKAWIARLKEMELQFINLVAEANPEKLTHVFFFGLAPRQLIK